MRKSSPALAKEGLPCLWLLTAVSLCLALLGLVWPSLAALLLLALALNFFRDPERVIPQDEGLAVSPADGKVVAVEQARDPISGETRTAIRIFMNVFDVHVNRSPVTGAVTHIRYIPGTFVNASLDKASEDNERCALVIEESPERRFTVVQIAGLIARRIVCLAETGDTLARGERLGMIKFGSRVDVYLPRDYLPKVIKGDKVLAGVSVIAAVRP